MRERRENQEIRRDLSFRSATEDDLERLIEVHFSAYPLNESATSRRRWFTHNRFGSLDDLIVAVDRRAKTIAGHAFLFPFRAWFGGRPVRMGGIASVGIAAEARGRGVASALMDHLHELSDTRGDALTMLYAFRHGFYARHAYGMTSSRKRIVFDPRSVPASWRHLSLLRVRAVRGGDRSGIRDVHARAAARSSGWITRSKRFWETFLSREQRLLLVCNRESEDSTGSKRKTKGGDSPISGYVAFELSQPQDHGETRLEVHELVADDDASRLSLIGALATLRDQVTEISLEIAESDPLERALIDPDARRFGTPEVEHSLGEIVGGPMVRIEDVARAIEARGYGRTPSSIDFDVVVREDGATSAEDESAVGVAMRDGRAEVGPARGGVALQTTRAGLASILYGGLSVRDAVRLGLAMVTAASDSKRHSAIERLDAIVRLDSLTPFDAF